MSLRLSFDHDLDLPALRLLVDRIAADRASWRDLVNFDTEHRHYAQLCATTTSTCGSSPG